MTASPVIAIDAMGGDHAPAAIIHGTALAALRQPLAKYILFGDQAQLAPLLASHQHLAARASIRHTPDVVGAAVKPSVALRQGRQSSMRLALDAVASGEAQCAVSAGNTGALMALAKFVLKTLPEIDRPALAALLPTIKGETLVLDLGANLECDTEHLVQFALMGTIFARTVLGLSAPTVGLLNIGAEEIKGHEEIRAAAALLRERHFPGNFIGFVEGDDICKGTADVVVTDGFTGNVALKTAEGTAKLITTYLKQALQSSLLSKLGALLAREAFNDVKKRLDPRRYNGAMLLGLQGLCVKSHGGTDAEGFSNAVDLAIDLVTQQYNERIRAELDRHYGNQSGAIATPAELPA